MQIRVEDKSLVVESDHFTARMEGGVLTSVVDRAGGVEFCRREALPFPLELTYLNGDVVAAARGQNMEVTDVTGEVGGGPRPYGSYVKLLSPLTARVLLVAEDTDRELFIRLDPDTGDLCIQPGAHCARRSLQTVRWNVPFAKEAALILPCHSGMEIVADREHAPAARTDWPAHWRAQLVIAQRGASSMMIHSEDTHYKYKGLSFTRDEDRSATLGFESEQGAPLHDNRTAGGVEWRINTYDGDWKIPADRYRAWMSRTYDLPAKRAARPEWTRNISLAICWASANTQLLDSLAKVHPPEETLIHLDQWRTDPYDVNYPRFVPSADAAAYLAKANDMGFKVMPHFNYFGCCKGHPLYEHIRDWQVRDLRKNDPQGWFFPIDNSKDFYRMSYIHAGLAEWRRELIDNVTGACDGLAAPAAFLDQTYHTWNCNPNVVENMTMVEGLARMQEELSWIRPELVLAGECLHEIAFQREAFAQMHPMGWGGMAQQHVEASHPICSYLWKGHTALIGYIELEPWNERIEVSIAIHRKIGVIPTIVTRERAAADPDLLDPAKNPAMKHILDWVAEQKG